MRAKKVKALVRLIIPDDKTLMSNPEKWPMWPYLPIKRRPPENPKAYDWVWALLWAGDWRLHLDDPGDEATPTMPLVLRDKIKVYLAGLYRLPPTVEEFRKTEKHSYDSVDALIADGWVVD